MSRTHRNYITLQAERFCCIDSMSSMSSFIGHGLDRSFMRRNSSFFFFFISISRFCQTKCGFLRFFFCCFDASIQKDLHVEILSELSLVLAAFFNSAVSLSLIFLIFWKEAMSMPSNLFPLIFFSFPFHFPPVGRDDLTMTPFCRKPR